MRTIVTEILIVVALIMVNAIFAGTEIAVLSMRKTRLRELIEDGSKRARTLQNLREKPERFLATVQIGITVVGAAAAAFGGATLDAPIEAALRRAGIGYAEELSFAIVVAAVSYLSLVIGELVPKSLALRYSEGYAMTVARPIAGLAWLMRPLVWFLTASSNLILRLFGDRTTFTESRLSPDELQQMVEEAAKEGALDPRVGEIASRAFDFSSLQVQDAMVPRGRVVAIDRRATPDEVQRIILEEGHSRMPVFDGSLDNIVGYVIAKDVLALVWERQLIVLADIVRPAYLILPTARAVDVLSEMQRRRCHLAVVANEQGGVVGVVTTEDLVEELVGDILGEHDAPADLYRQQPDGSYIVQGTAGIRDINRDLDLDLPISEDYSTIAGFTIQLAVGIPTAGTKLTTEDGTEIEVMDATLRRVRVVRIRKPEKKPAPDDGETTPDAEDAEKPDAET